MKLTVYTKDNNWYRWELETLVHCRERAKRIILEGLLLEWPTHKKEEFYPPSHIFKVVIEGVEYESPIRNFECSG